MYQLSSQFCSATAYCRWSAGLLLCLVRHRACTKSLLYTRSQLQLTRPIMVVDYFLVKNSGCYYFLTRNSSGDEIANVNFLYDDIVHALKILDSCINSATDRFLQRRFTKFSEITQCNGHYAVQGHSTSPILVPIESSYIQLPIIVINTNLLPISHRFQVMADYWSNFT